jgi:hypothetical protein
MYCIIYLTGLEAISLPGGMRKRSVEAFFADAQARDPLLGQRVPAARRAIPRLSANPTGGCEPCPHRDIDNHA